MDLEKLLYWIPAFARMTKGKNRFLILFFSGNWQLATDN